MASLLVEQQENERHVATETKVVVLHHDGQEHLAWDADEFMAYALRKEVRKSQGQQAWVPLELVGQIAM